MNCVDMQMALRIINAQYPKEENFFSYSNIVTQVQITFYPAIEFICTIVYYTEAFFSLIVKKKNNEQNENVAF